MKKVLLLTALWGVGTVSVYADEAQFTFTAEIVPSTCSAVTDEKNKIFPLKDIPLEQIATVGQESSDTYNNTQTLTLHKCPAGTKIKFWLSSGTLTGDSLPNISTDANKAQNARVRLYRKQTTTADTKITLGEANAWRYTVPTSLGTATTDVTQEFTAKYYNPVGSDIGVGVVKAEATLNIVYE